MDHISVIIVNFNGDKDTHECIASLAKSELNREFKFNVVVVDNASKEPFKLSSSEQKMEVELLRSDSNLGFTGGNNLGITQARDKFNSDFFLLLNNDTVVDPEFIKNLHKCARNHPRAGLVNPKIYFTPGKEFHLSSYTKEERGQVIWFAGGSIDWRNLVAFHRGVDEVDRGQFDYQVDAQDFATGCALLIRRELVETIGLLNDDLFLYLEDVEYSLRAKRAGFEVLFCPESVIWHHNAGSSGGAGSKLALYYQTRNRLATFMSYGFPREKITTLHLIWQILVTGNATQREALRDWVQGHMGKKTILE